MDKKKLDDIMANIDAKNKEIWNTIVDYYNTNKYTHQIELAVVWEGIFTELLGYKLLNGDIEKQRRLRMENGELIIVDLILKNEGQEEFVVQVKQHDIPFKTGMEFPLMRAIDNIHTDFGLYICDKIFMFSYDQSRSDVNQARVEIEFVKNSAEGIKFVEFFKKQSYDKQQILDYIFSKDKTLQAIKDLKKELDLVMLRRILVKHYKKKYGEEDINKALDQFEFNISFVADNIQSVQTAADNQSRQMMAVNNNMNNIANIDNADSKFLPTIGHSTAQNLYNATTVDAYSPFNHSPTSHVKLLKEYYINNEQTSEEQFEEFLVYTNYSVLVTLFYKDGNKISEVWDIETFTSNSSLERDLYFKYLRNWQDKDIVKVRLDLEVSQNPYRQFAPNYKI
ncbi:MAG: hypothetical protein LBU60_01845 [Clostridiales bacterium]|nr:hypothetical protein [Clostridiales bacterium]